MNWALIIIAIFISVAPVCLAARVGLGSAAQGAMAVRDAQLDGDIARLKGIISDPDASKTEKDNAKRELIGKQAEKASLQNSMKGTADAMAQAQQSDGGGKGGGGGGGGKKEEKSSPMPPPPPPPPPEKKEEAKKPAESPMPTVSFAPLPSSSPQADKPIENSADKGTSRGVTSAESDTTKKIAELREQKLQSELADLSAVTEAAKKDLAAKTQAARASLNVAGAEGAKPAVTPAPKQTLGNKLSSVATNTSRPHPAPKSKKATGHIATIPMKKAMMASVASPMDRLFFSAKPSATEEHLPVATSVNASVTSSSRGIASQAVEAMGNKAAEEATSRYLKENSRLVAGSFPTPKK